MSARAPTEAPSRGLDAAAHDLARIHVLSEQKPKMLASLTGLSAMLGWLAQARAVLPAAESAAAGKAAEWLLDNIYVVEDAIREVQTDLPARYYAHLPALASDDDRHAPRVYAIAHGLVREVTLQLTADPVIRFTNAYQEISSLDLGELWALPTMLRLTCLEVLAGALERLAPSLHAPFATDSDDRLLPSLDDAECVARSIRGLTILASISWQDFVQQTSVIEAVLQDDPVGCYERMDVETRDHYRRVVEDLARRSHHTEPDIARRAVACARQAAAGACRMSHVGYWLVDQGRAQFERSLGYQLHWQERAQRSLRKHATSFYLGALLLLTVSFDLVLGLYLARVSASPVLWTGGMFLGLLPASMLALTLLHYVISRVLPPSVLPKLALEEGIPSQYKSAVVIPSLLGNAAELQQLLDQIERHYLCNPDPSLRFVLLTGFPEADVPERPEDRDLRRQAISGIQHLNDAHGSNGHGPFHLLHRERRYNESEGRWMGRERKRGKLEELNRLIAGNDETEFVVQEGDTEKLRGVRFVITLDADTVLPHEAAARLVGTLAHPLNRAEFEPNSSQVVAGYTIVQPRLETSPQSAGRSPFMRVYCGDTAIDIYSRAVSDVYQDLFGTGVYVGKGIYDVAAFSRSLADRVPENAILSHDLFEGIHGRVALATDIVLYEDYPSTYLAFTRRLSRWVRGDWQLVPWLLPRVPGAGSDYLPSRFLTINRWKILDNLRRSLLPLALLLFIISGWIWFPGHALVWTLFGILAPTGPLFVEFANGLVREKGHLHSGLRRSLGEHLERWLLFLVFLPHQAAVTTQAIARTLVRVTVTRRHLMQWTTAAQTTASIAGRRARRLAWREMAAGPLTAIATAAALAYWRSSTLPYAAPLLVLWLVSPGIAERISRPYRPRGERLTAEQIEFLRRLARRTWLFFEVFVGPDDHWLPPDNYQEDPNVGIAHRTSPTNIGMMLLSTLAAYDLGYVSPRGLVVRLRNSLETVGRLQHYRGHLLNWYDTRTLTPLAPRYVSSVDSGNLAGALLAVEAACAEVQSAPCLRRTLWEGLADTIALLEDSLERMIEEGDGSVLSEPGKRARAMRQAALAARNAPESWLQTIQTLSKVESGDLEQLVLETIAEPGVSTDPLALHEVRLWLSRVREHIQGMQDELASLAPWLSLLDAAPSALNPNAVEPKLLATRSQLAKLLSPTISIDAVPRHCELARELISDLRDRLGNDEATLDRDSSAIIGWLGDLERSLDLGERNASDLQVELAGVAAQAVHEVVGMDFRLLYDLRVRHLHIGYNVDADQIDPHHYDLLASEARLASFVAIAKGDLPVQHWFALERPLTKTKGGPALLSWGGTMFEYLMPPILMRRYDDTLLARSERAAVEQQMADGRSRKVPWGVSESGYAAVDADHNYRYHAFGSPGLGRKRGLDDDIVIAPYATALALPLFPSFAFQNLTHLCEWGALGTYGLYEALDFTPSRLPEGRSCSIVSSYMAHHQGMTLAALDNLLCDEALVRRFEADASVKATQLLLQERVPDVFPVKTTRGPEVAVQRPRETQPVALPPWRPKQLAASPQIHALGNGRLGSWVTDAGSGAIRWRGHAVTRWMPDRALDASGLWVYVRDEESGAVWSAGRQPAGLHGAETDAVFHAHMVELHTRHRGVALRMDIAVGPADDIEMRRITVVNETSRHRHLSLTSYGEVVLAPSIDDARHLAFSKLFVEGTAQPELDALVFTRRPREPGEHPPVVMHRLLADSDAVQCIGFEIDRERFLGRNGSARFPRAMQAGLSSTAGTTLDTIMALQARVDLAPYATEQLAFVTMASSSRSSVEEIAARYGTLASLEWLLEDAYTDAGREVQRLGLDPGRLPELQELLSLLLDRGSALRADPETIAANRLGRPQLWGLGISGDNPILLLRTSDPSKDNLLADLIRAHELWRRRGIAIDLVVQSQTASAYRDDALQGAHRLVSDLGAAEWLGRHGGIHLVRQDQVEEDELRFLAAAAAVVLESDGRSLAAHLPPQVEPHPLPRLVATRLAARHDATKPLDRPKDLLFDNGLGGFSRDGREYVIHLQPGQTTPAPWCNVLANEEFGCLVTEAGGGYTWATNSGEFRLTPWTNDPVLDPPGEVLYLRDEETAEVWTPTPKPAGRKVGCEVRHGAGYTEWKQNSHGFEQRLRVFVPPDDPVKIIHLRLRNCETRARRVTATYYAQWVLGLSPNVSGAHVVPHYDAEVHAIVARNPWNPDFAERVAFLSSDRNPHGFTADRTEFLGREGDVASPAALERLGLSGTARAGLDPCAALQVHLDIAPGEEVETFFVLGAGQDTEHMRELVHSWRDPARVEEAWKRLGVHWDSLLDAVTVRTPAKEMDLMLNRWALYQVLSSRILGRTGFYQSSGAFGFRDQLQDVLAITHVDPAMTRQHILKSAARQFEEGDVLHWWHPPRGRGVRTRCSDDLLWLPYVTARYVEATGDLTILDEQVPFLTGPPLRPDEHDRFALFESSTATESLFEHCRRALKRGVTQGPRGLPLMGDGDWNDGMNRVGSRGRGESVWLAWFAIAAMDGFASLCEQRGEDDHAQSWRDRSRELAAVVEREGWDGAWYRRAYDDDGKPWGSSASEECRIDSITQSWAVLSGAAPLERSAQALRSADSELLREDQKLLRLLWPPFDATVRDPGYIKAYPPGIRENGGQYTHAGVWLAWAFAESGDWEQSARITQLLNPIEHSRSKDDALCYRLEPYVLAADIASVEPQVGRGGWSWYTGSAAWFWRLGIEVILGLRRVGGGLRIDPRIPADWPGFHATIRTEGGVLEIEVENPKGPGHGVAELLLDGEPIDGEEIPLPDDGKTHEVRVRLRGHERGT